MSAPADAPGPLAAVLLVEDEPAWEGEARLALAALAPAAVHVARTVGQAMRLAARHRFDLALVDLGLPDGSGVALIRHLAAAAPPPVCVARTVFDDDAHLFGALAAGAQGYLLKGEPVETLQARLAAALRGEPAVSPAIARRVLAHFRQDAPPPPASPLRAPLTARESDVLRAIGRGLTVAEAAQALRVSENTVKTHLKGAYAKLDVTSRVEAMHAARRLGLLGGG